MVRKIIAIDTALYGRGLLTHARRTPCGIAYSFFSTEKNCSENEKKFNEN
jgi:hypothetical protein